jgi:hypothetical protein
MGRSGRIVRELVVERLGCLGGIVGSPGCVVPPPSAYKGKHAVKVLC